MDLRALTSGVREAKFFSGGDIFRPTADSYCLVPERISGGVNDSKVCYTLLIYRYVAGDSFSYEVTTQQRGQGNLLVNLSITVTTSQQYYNAAMSFYETWKALGARPF